MSIDLIPVIIQQKKQYFYGMLTKGKIKIKKEINKKAFQELEDKKELQTISYYLTSLELEDKIRKRLEKKLKEVSFIVPCPIDPTNNEWEAYWMRKINNLCKSCTEDCKQSSFAEIVSCPQYKKEK